MQKKNNFLYLFLFLAAISIVLIFLSKSGKLGFLSGSASFVSSPVERFVWNIFNIDLRNSSSKQSLTDENTALRKKIIDQQNLSKDNSALKDQFQLSYPAPTDLLPANIIGSPGLIPGVSKPEYLILDKGSKNNVKIGDAVVLKDSLVGKVVLTDWYISKVELVSNKSSSFTANAVSYEDGREVLGVVKGNGNEEIVLDNVLLSDTIKIGDSVVTKGDVSEKNEGYPPNLIVGKIVSVEKKDSDLFQKAAVLSPLNFASISKVFIIVK